MTKTRYRVHVVVDPEYGEQLRGLPEGEPVWLIDTQININVSLELGRERQPEDYLTGYTSFSRDAGGSREETFIGLVSDLELHHGELSHDPPCSALNVIGVQWSDRIGEELSKLGYSHWEDTPEGFVATRELGQQKSGPDAEGPRRSD